MFLILKSTFINEERSGLLHNPITTLYIANIVSLRKKAVDSMWQQAKCKLTYSYNKLFVS